jgi:twinkle protein
MIALPPNPYLFVEDLEDWVHKELTDPPRGIQFPDWPEFTRLTGGLRMNELTLLTSGTGTGKTTFLANLATQACLMSIPSYVASVEIGAGAFLLSMLSVVSKRDLNTGDPVAVEEVEQIKQKYMPLLRTARIVFSKHDNRVDPETLCQEIETAHKRYGVKFVILDNLQYFSRLVEAERERLEQDRVIRHFVNLVRNHSMHVFLIVHCRKGNGDNQRIESLSEIKGSKTLSDEANNVLALNKPSTEDIKADKARPTDRELLILKMRRRGKSVGRHTSFYFDNGKYQEVRRAGPHL